MRTDPPAAAVYRMVPVAVLALVLSACGGSDTAATSVVSPPASVQDTPGCGGIGLRSRVAMYQAAKDGTIPPAAPSILGGAVVAVPPGLFTGVLYGGCYSEIIDGLRFEQMAWTNGIGLLLISLQEWPDDGPLVTLPFGGASRQAGVVQVTVWPPPSNNPVADDSAVERIRVATLFDGMRVLSVTTFGLTTLSVEQAEEIAWGAYDALPLISAHPPDDGRGLSGLIEELPTDTISVSSPVPVDTLSPFTTALGMVTATSRFIVGGATLTAFDFGARGAADRAERALSADGYTIAHQPYELVGTPRFWRWDRVLVQYTGADLDVLARLVEVMGQPFAGPEVVIPE